MSPPPNAVRCLNEANGRFPTLEELVNLTGYKKPTFYRMATMEYLDKSMFYEEEDDILESLTQKVLANDLKIKSETRIVVSK